jgi:hypothetical protein
MTLPLPIPGKKEKLAFFLIPYNLKADYTNLKGEVFMRETESVLEFRKAISERFGVNPSSFLITIVADNQIKKMVDINSKVEDIADNRGQGSILLYEINPELNP